MSIGGIGTRSAFQTERLIAMRRQLDDLQRQIGTGKKANDYAGVGPGRGLAIGLRAQRAAISAFGDSINVLGTRLNLAQTALADIDAAVRVVKQGLPKAAFELDAYGRTTDQTTARGQLDRMLAAMNAQFGDQYIFAGQSADRPAVDSIDHILDGDGARAGFRQVMLQRSQADLGANGLGRLVVSGAASTNGTLTGAGAAIPPDADVLVTGTVDLAARTPLAGTLTLNGVAVAIGANDTAATIRDNINTAMAGAPVGTHVVTASLDGGGHLVLESPAADTSIDVTGNDDALLSNLGLPTGLAKWTNLLTNPHGVTSGQTLTLTIGANPPLTLTFGAGAGQVSTIAEANAALAALSGGTASLNAANGNLSVTATHNTDAIGISGTAAPAVFGLSAAQAAVSEDVAGSVFGMKVASVATTIAGATTTQPSGTPKSMSVALDGATPQAGDTVAFTFNLPDGTSEKIVLTATSAAAPGENEFAIGTTAGATAANLRGALTTAVGKLADTALSAASAIAAANDFFNVDGANPPRRVNGPPFASATALTAGTSANTVSWYLGEAGGMPARATAAARVDTAITVAFGMRANEEGLRNPVANLAAFAAMTFSAGDPDAKERYAALTQRLQVNLNSPPGVQKIADIEAELAGAQTAMAAAKERHTQTDTALANLLDDIEGAPLEEVGAKILTVQTSLQASLQTTARLAELSLVNFL